MTGERKVGGEGRERWLEGLNPHNRDRMMPMERVKRRMCRFEKKG